MRNETEIKLKQYTETNLFYFSQPPTTLLYFSFISVLFKRLALFLWYKKRWNNQRRRGLSQLWNKSKTFQSCFSVLFQFRFTCAGVWNKTETKQTEMCSILVFPHSSCQRIRGFFYVHALYKFTFDIWHFDISNSIFTQECLIQYNNF